MFHLIFVHHMFSSLFGLLSDHLCGNSCPLGLPFVLVVFCLFVILVISYFGFKSRICLFIAPVTVHCVLVTFLLNKTCQMKWTENYCWVYCRTIYANFMPEMHVMRDNLHASEFSFSRL